MKEIPVCYSSEGSFVWSAIKRGDVGEKMAGSLGSMDLGVS